MGWGLVRLVGDEGGRFVKKFFLYLIRWQLSSPILAVCMVWMGGWNVIIATIVANLIGGCIFFWVDRWIFGDKKVKSDSVESGDELVPAVVPVVAEDEEEYEDELI